MIRNCIICQKEYKTFPSRLKKRRYRACSRKCGCILRTQHLQGVNHPNWKGNNAGGKPNKCSRCDLESENRRYFHWANISGEYKRDLSDWKRLCAKCHGQFDANKRLERKKNLNHAFN